MGRHDIKKLEEYWINYDHLKWQLEFREFQLLYKEHDTNVGGGKSNLPSSPTEQQVIKLQLDDLYSNLQKITEAIARIYNEADSDERFIVNARYFGKYDAYEWDDIAHELTKRQNDDKIISRNATIRKRNKIMQRTAKAIGWVSVV